VGVSKHTIYGWKAKYGGMDVSPAQEAKQLRDENKDVGRLNVPVDDALLMRGIQSIGDLDGPDPEGTPAARACRPIWYLSVRPSKNSIQKPPAFRGWRSREWCKYWDGSPQGSITHHRNQKCPATGWLLYAQNLSCTFQWRTFRQRHSHFYFGMQSNW
jgi:hypothetical protein